MKINQWLFCFALIVLHFLYTISFPSIINGEQYIGLQDHLIEPTYIEAFHHSRLTFEEFARRPFTSALINSVSTYGVSISRAFLLVEYAGLFLSLLLLFQLALRLGKSNAGAYVSVALFAFSFWVIHAFFAEIYAYDEPWQYVFLFASFLFLEKWRLAWFALFFLFATIVRESTLLLLPGIIGFIVLNDLKLSKQNALKVAKIIWIVPVYGAFAYWIISMKGLGEKTAEYALNERWKHLYYSFASADLALDTVVSLVMSSIVPFTLLLAVRINTNGSDDKRWSSAFLISFALNTLISLLFTMGRETRIFAQPVVLIAPFLGAYAVQRFQSVQMQLPLVVGFSRKHALSIAISWLLIFGISLFAYELYWPTDTKFMIGFQYHVFLTFSACAIIWMLRVIRFQVPVHQLKRAVFLLLLTLPILVFLRNQHGYRYYPYFAELEERIIERNGSLMLVSTNMPSIAERYFESKDVPVFAADFNSLESVVRCIDSATSATNEQLIFVEFEPTRSWPIAYFLGTLGKTTAFQLGDFNGVVLDKTNPVEIEPNTFFYSVTSSSFELKNSVEEQNNDIVIQEEYGPTFKYSLAALGLDSLTSITALVEFESQLYEEASIVISVENTSIWEHVYLKDFNQRDEPLSRAIIGKGFKTVSDSAAVIAVYVWNPSRENVVIKNMQFTINSAFVPVTAKPRNVLDSRNLW